MHQICLHVHDNLCDARRFRRLRGRAVITASGSAVEEASSSIVKVTSAQDLLGLGSARSDTDVDLDGMSQGVGARKASSPTVGAMAMVQGFSPTSASGS